MNSWSRAWNSRANNFLKLNSLLARWLEQAHWAWKVAMATIIRCGPTKGGSYGLEARDGHDKLTHKFVVALNEMTRTGLCWARPPHARPTPPPSSRRTALALVWPPAHAARSSAAADARRHERSLVSAGEKEVRSTAVPASSRSTRGHRWCLCAASPPLPSLRALASP